MILHFVFLVNFALFPSAIKPLISPSSTFGFCCELHLYMHQLGSVPACGFRACELAARMGHALHACDVLTILWSVASGGYDHGPAQQGGEGGKGTTTHGVGITFGGGSGSRFPESGQFAGATADLVAQGSRMNTHTLWQLGGRLRGEKTHGSREWTNRQDSITTLDDLQGTPTRSVCSR